MTVEPIPRDQWTLDGVDSHVCSEPCCELRRVASTSRQVTTEDALREVLTKPEVFWW